MNLTVSQVRQINDVVQSLQSIAGSLGNIADSLCSIDDKATNLAMLRQISMTLREVRDINQGTLNWMKDRE